jgi:hypothetical protein
VNRLQGIPPLQAFLWKETMLEAFLLAACLVLFFEGALYALFPDGMKQMMLSVLQVPSRNLRIFGLAAALLGVVLAWIVRA